MDYGAKIVDRRAMAPVLNLLGDFCWHTELEVIKAASSFAGLAVIPTLKAYGFGIEERPSSVETMREFRLLPVRSRNRYESYSPMMTSIVDGIRPKATEARA
jgi:hypothetical protein